MLKNKIKFFLLWLWNKYIFMNMKFFFILNKNLYKKIYIKKLKIIFIKPYNYLDIYNKSINNNILDVMDSNYRMGPVGLFTNHNTNLVISDSYDGLEIDFNISKQKLDKKRLKVLKKQKSNGKNIEKINFDKYDIAISFENTISQKIISKYSKVLWFKILEDHNNKSYKKNIFFKPVLFDGLLNQTLGFTPYSIFRRSHSIDFSYTFGNSTFLKKVQENNIKNIDIILEVNQSNYIKKSIVELKRKYQNIKKIHLLDENLSHKNYISKLSKGRYFFAISSNTPRWGNSLIEAAICQNLLIGNRNNFWNSQLIINELHCTDLEKALFLADTLNRDKKLYKRYLIKQNFFLNYLNYERPLQQILDYSINCNRDLNINKKF